MFNFICDMDSMAEILRNKGFEEGDITVTGIIIENSSKERFLIAKDDNSGKYTVGKVDIQRV